MSIEFVDIDENIRRISLGGRLDILGTEAISTEFTKLSADAKQGVVVDLSAVSFLASMGIRELITNAKALQKRGARMVLYVGTNGLVTKILETTNINQLLPMFKDLVEAEKAVLI
jgi:anti-anti-sigma factor